MSGPLRPQAAHTVSSLSVLPTSTEAVSSLSSGECTERRSAGVPPALQSSLLDMSFYDSHRSSMCMRLLQAVPHQQLLRSSHFQTLVTLWSCDQTFCHIPRHCDITTGESKFPTLKPGWPRSLLYDADQGTELGEPPSPTSAILYL